MAITILDGFAVEVDKGDKYRSAHLFVRGRFVHEIKFLNNGQVILSDAEFFTGARKELNENEIEQLRAVYSELKREEEQEKERKQKSQSAAAKQVSDALEQKLEQFGDPQIFD